MDPTRWTLWKGAATTKEGRGTVAPVPANQFRLAGIWTREKHFNPGLSGTNGVEVTLVDFELLGDPPAFDAATAQRLGIKLNIEAMGPHFITGFSLLLADYYGQI